MIFRGYRLGRRDLIAGAVTGAARTILRADNREVGDVAVEARIAVQG